MSGGLPRVLAGIYLGERAARSMPGDSLAERAARANLLIRAMWLMRNTDWQPTFPFSAQR